MNILIFIFTDIAHIIIITTETLVNIIINNLLCKSMSVYINNTPTSTREPET